MELANNDKNKIPKTIRNQIWNLYIGEKYKNLCFAGCNTEINVFNFECGHVESKSNGGCSNIYNLRPICSTCNRSIGIKNMVEFMKEHGRNINSNWDGIFRKNHKKEIRNAMIILYNWLHFEKYMEIPIICKDKYCDEKTIDYQQDEVIIHAPLNTYIYTNDDNETIKISGENDGVFNPILDVAVRELDEKNNTHIMYGFIILSDNNAYNEHRIKKLRFFCKKYEITADIYGISLKWIMKQSHQPKNFDLMYIWSKKHIGCKDLGCIWLEYDTDK